MLLSILVGGADKRSSSSNDDGNDGIGIDEEYHEDPNFKAIEHQYLIFPMTEKDFWNWGSQGSALLHQNKAVIAPEAKGMKGLIYTT